MSAKIKEGTFPCPTLHHVNLKTTRMQEMIDWYTIITGMTVQHQFPGGAWLTNDGANHRLALLTLPQLSDDPDKLRHTGIHHLAFEHGSIDDLLDSYLRLKALAGHPPPRLSGSRYDHLHVLCRSRWQQCRTASR
jgi:catechol 2,3-dioxygenase